MQKQFYSPSSGWTFKKEKEKKKKTRKNKERKKYNIDKSWKQNTIYNRNRKIINKRFIIVNATIIEHVLFNYSASMFCFNCPLFF